MLNRQDGFSSNAAVGDILCSASEDGNQLVRMSTSCASSLSSCSVLIVEDMNMTTSR